MTAVTWSDQIDLSRIKPYKDVVRSQSMKPNVLLGQQMSLIDCVYMLEHNRVMNILNKHWIHVNSFIRSASHKGSSQDRISVVDTIAGLEPVIVGYLPACVLDRIALPGRTSDGKQDAPGHQSCRYVGRPAFSGHTGGKPEMCMQCVCVCVLVCMCVYLPIMCTHYFN